ncbi:MAG: fumarylacetoacetate hydrolase family protein [Rhodospirillales bacterium]
MKLISYRQGETAGYGATDGSKVWPLAGRAGLPATLAPALALPDLVTKAEALVSSSKAPALALDEVTLLPVIPTPGKVFCVGLNYESHRIETGRPESKYPTLFTRFASTLVAEGEALVCPRLSEKFDYEGELAVVIGKPGRHIAKADALSHVAGYSCFNDGSVRDFQRHSSQFTPGKNFDASAGFGPWLVTADEIPDPSALKLETRLDGTVMQAAGLDDLIFDVETLIAYISGFATLEPGDVIATGTPGGVGFVRKPPVYMQPGSSVTVAISQVGTLTNPVIAEDA